MKTLMFARMGLAALCIMLGACNGLPQSAQPNNEIYHYIRSNRDGTRPEHVVVFRPGRTTISVYKWVEKCATAALVTAVMNTDLQEGSQFVAGKVAPDGSQSSFGTLLLDPETSTLSVDITPPGGSRITEQWVLQGRPYLLFDFDLADLNAFLQERRPRKNFSFRLPAVWPSETSLFRDFGTLHANYAGPEEHLGRKTVRFELRVAGPEASSGTLWIDEQRGFIIEADLGLPNHEGYKDFSLKLQSVQTGGLNSWISLTKAHYDKCEKP